MMLMFPNSCAVAVRFHATLSRGVPTSDSKGRLVQMAIEPTIRGDLSNNLELMYIC